MDLATIMRRPMEVQPVKSEVEKIIEQSRFVTKRRQKDFNGNHPDFHELLTTEDYTQYRDNSQYSEGSTEEDETPEELTEEMPPEPCQPITDEGIPDEPFNASELNKTESPSCCPLLSRRRSFDKDKNARLAREGFKRKSQEKRIATFNTLRSKATSQTCSSNTSAASSNESEETLLPHVAENATINCNNNLKASENSPDDVSSDFESLIHNKISEIEFKEDDDSSTDDQLFGSRNFTLTTHADTFLMSDKRVDSGLFTINSRLPQLSRPSEMFVVKNGRNLIENEPPKKNPVKHEPQFTRMMLSSKTLHLISGLVIVLMILYIFYVVILYCNNL